MLVRRLVGLQAQEGFSPYIGLWSRIAGFAPAQLSGLIERRELVRIVVMRGTIHLLTPQDCATIRPLMQNMIDAAHRRTPFYRACQDVDLAALERAARRVLRNGPVPASDLGATLAHRFPDHRPSDLVNMARVRLPVLQLPPRGLWKQRGPVVYALADQWTGLAARHGSQRDKEELVRRYLRAFGPACAADLATWSRWSGTAAAIARIEPELVRYRRESGSELVDLDGLPIADSELPAPVRLLGTYDNVLLSHADRTRITDQAAYQAWQAPNGGISPFLLLDGFVAGLWRERGGRVRVEPLRAFSRAEQRAVDAEAASLEAFLLS